MKKIFTIGLCLIICVTAVGCGNNNTSPEPSSDTSTVQENQNTSFEQSEVNDKETSKTADEESTDTKTTHELLNDEIESAKQAALDYYTNTVFEVNSIEYVDKKKGDCAFSVNVSKAGVVQEPNRTIYLKFNKNDLWEVIGEGY